MASTYTPLGIEIQATGENAGTWGTKTNTNLEILEQISGGFIQKSIAGSAQTTALAVTDGGTGAELAHRMIEFTGTITGNQIVTIPNDVQNLYFLKNSTSGAYTVQFKYATGSGDSFTFSATDKGTKIVFASGNPDTTNPKILEISTGSDVVDDTTPQLGGNLDTNSFNISFDDAHGITDENGNEQIIFQTTSSAVNQIDVTNAATGNAPSISATGDDSNIDLALIPKGTGETKVGTGAAAATVTSSGAYDLVLDTNSGSNSGNITITDGANGDITATPNGTGKVVVGGNTNPGTLVLNCEANSHGIKLQSPAHSANQSYTLKFPTGNVTADRFLKVDSVSGSGTTGVGQLSFAEVSGGTSWQAVKTANFNAAAGEGYFVNTTGGAITATLPASPSIGNSFIFKDYAQTWNSNNFLIDPNGNKFEGLDDVTHYAMQNRQAIEIVYSDSTKGYVLTASANSTADANSGGFNISAPYTSNWVVVAGGGGGRTPLVPYGGGGGGAGGYRAAFASEPTGGSASGESAITLTPGATYTITVGAGGSKNSNGSDSSIAGPGVTTITSIGGGRGNYNNSNTATSAGGSGGGGVSAQEGGGGPVIPGGAGTAGQGNDGGAGSSGGSNRSGGSGGGATQVGGNGVQNGSANPGGDGQATAITGSSVTLAGGGGGGGQSGPAGGGPGGAGGGGGGSTGNNEPAGTANTGGGGGASANNAGPGGSGIVILRIPTSNYSGTITGSPTVSVVGTDTVLQFTASGTYVA
jgi:hypothetical protein|tara:strand:- start:2364 stop:4628 length:2265 start_codon:yes stop_codon:yes gene_type:complete